jgi:hypothetical protein
MIEPIDLILVQNVESDWSTLPSFYVSLDLISLHSMEKKIVIVKA